MWGGVLLPLICAAADRKPVASRALTFGASAGPASDDSIAVGRVAKRKHAVTVHAKHSENVDEDAEQEVPIPRVTQVCDSSTLDARVPSQRLP